jgi:hypothetical protein
MYDVDGRRSHNLKDLEAAACAILKQHGDSSLAGDKSDDDSSYLLVFRRATFVWRAKCTLKSKCSQTSEWRQRHLLANSVQRFFRLRLRSASSAPGLQCLLTFRS